MVRHRQGMQQESASVPWAAISTNIGIYIPSHYLQQHCAFKEPTCLTSQEVTIILEFWQDRQVSHPADILTFSKWQDMDGRLQDMDGRFQDMDGRLQDPVNCHDSSEG